MSPIHIDCLDGGYVRFVEAWGSDQAFIEAARMSTDKGFEGWEKDFKLLKFLYKNQHMTPFEMGGFIIEVKAPLFVFREWHRHRVPFSYNEMSARYVPLPNENYLPTAEALVARSAAAAQSSNKQAAGAKAIAFLDAEAWLKGLEEVYKDAQSIYQWGLHIGVPKELARLPVPVARYSRMRAGGNVRGWMHFLGLRMAPNAQWEIRQYAQAVHCIFQHCFPKTAMLFDGVE